MSRKIHNVVFDTIEERDQWILDFIDNVTNINQQYPWHIRDMYECNGKYVVEYTS